MNLSPGGLDDPTGPGGFPYFAAAAAEGKFEFGGYGGPPGPFHPHDGPFFHGHAGGQLPFTGPGKFFLSMFDFFVF